MTTPRLIRPVRCHLCDQPMFYYGDPKHEPEVFVTVEQAEKPTMARFHAHIRCWNARMTSPQEQGSVCLPETDKSTAIILALDAMAITKRLFTLPDGHILCYARRELEKAFP